jgi:haloalkane dehalogenase
MTSIDSPSLSLALPADLQQEYPFALRSMSIDGHRYAYIDEGAGPTLLFVHGNPTWSFAWRNIIRGLSGSFRCVAVDHIGMGLSEKPQDYGYRIGQHIENLCQFIQRLDLRDITLIGHDWGGCIGMGAAGRMPERFARFVMMNTAAFRSQRIPLRIAICRTPFFGPIGVQGMNLFSKAALSMAVVHHDRMTRLVRRGYLFPYDRWEHRLAVMRFVQEIPLNPRHPSWPTLVEVERGLEQFQRHPMQLIWGEQDWCFTTTFLNEWEERFPRARTLKLADAGHYVFEDAPERIVTCLREFLE